MIIIDLSNLLYLSLYSSMKLNQKKVPVLKDIRIILLNKIQDSRARLKQEFGEETIISVDSNSWRKDVFKGYKHKRKKTRDEDDLDWKVIHGYFSELEEELRSNSSYKVIKVNGAEADDTIAILSLLSKKTQDPVVIVGRDKDFFQLHSIPKLRQFDPNNNQFIDVIIEEIPYNLFTHICRSEVSDGIPSIISDINSFVTGTRQKPLRQTYITEAFNYAKQGKLEDFLGPERYKRFQENKTLVDFRMVPEVVKTNILNAYNTYEVKENNMFNYLIEHGIVENFKNVLKNF